MRNRTLVIAAVAAAALATSSTANARPVPLRHPGKHVVASQTAHRQLCICIIVVVPPERIAAEMAREQWQYDQDLIDAGLAPVYGTTGHYGYDAPVG